MALSQLKDILMKVQEDYGQRTAQKTYDKIDSKVNSLLRFPEIGAPDYNYSSLSAKGKVLVRHLLVVPNVIYYNVDGEIFNSSNIDDDSDTTISFLCSKVTIK